MLRESGLTRGPDQLRLLRLACDQHRAARLAYRGGGRTLVTRTRLLAIERDALLLEWPAPAPLQDIIWNTPIEISFRHAGRSLTCVTLTRGQVLTARGKRSSQHAWRVALPPRLTLRHRRRGLRASFGALEGAPLELRSLTRPGEALRGRVLNLSAGGLCGTVDPRDAARLSDGELLLAEFHLPDGGRALTFVAQVAHRSSQPGNSAKLVGCRFCPSEDADGYAAQLSIIEEFVSRRRRHSAVRRVVRTTEGR